MVDWRIRVKDSFFVPSALEVFPILFDKVDIKTLDFCCRSFRRSQVDLTRPFQNLNPKRDLDYILNNVYKYI